MNALAQGLCALLLFAALADGWLGIYLDGDSDRPRVLEVVPGSPAERAGLAAGDLIVALDGAATTTREAFVDAVRACKAGQKIRLRIERDGKERELDVELGTRPDDGGVPPRDGPGATDAPRTPPPAPAETRPVPAPVPAPAVQEPAPAPRAYVGVRLRERSGAVTVAEVVDDSPAQRGGLRSGDVLRRWGDREVASIGDIDSAVRAGAPGQRVTLQVERDGAGQELTVELGARAADAAAPAEVVEARDGPSTQRIEEAFATDLDDARQKAASGNFPLLIAYGASWDGKSQAQRRALLEPESLQLYGSLGLVCVYLDADRHRALLDERHVQELPVLEIERDGEVVWRHDGFLPAQQLQEQLRGGAGGLRSRQAVPTAEPRPAGPGKQPGARARSEAPPANEPSAEPAAEPAGPASEADDAAVAEELRRLREEVQELQRLLDELRRARGGRE
ncbi:MAG: PDZ domain-containing protein [Planctomycetota bacterium]